MYIYIYAHLIGVGKVFGRGGGHTVLRHLRCLASRHLTNHPRHLTDACRHRLRPLMTFECIWRCVRL